MLGQHYSSQCHLSSSSFGIECSHYLNDFLHCSLQHSSAALPKPLHLLIPPPHNKCLHPMSYPHVPSSAILFSFHLASQLQFPVLLSSFQSPFFSSSLKSKVSSQGFTPNLFGIPAPRPLWIQIIFFLVFPSNGKVVEIAECGLVVLEHSYYPPGEQDLKCVGLEGMEMLTLV